MTHNPLKLVVLSALLIMPVPGAVHGQGHSEAPSGERTIARVNGRPILSRDFNLAVQLQFRRRRLDERGHADLEAVRRQALETLIDNEILYQEAKDQDIDVEASELEAEYRSVEEAFGSPENLNAVLDANGMSREEFREQLRRSLLVAQFIDQQVVRKIRVSDDDVRRYYDEHPSEMQRQEGVRISQIVVEVRPGEPADVRAAARRSIESVLAQLRAGRDFSEVARQFAGASENQRAGDSGFVTRRGGALPPVEEAAFSLEVGEVSDVVETERGFHIIKATDRRPAGTIPFDEAKGPIRDRLVARERAARISEYVSALRESARIERTLPGTS